MTEVKNSEKILNELVIKYPYLRDFVECLQYDSEWTAQIIAKFTRIPGRTIRHYYKTGKLPGKKLPLVDMWVSDSQQVAAWAITYLPYMMEKRENNG